MNYKFTELYSGGECDGGIIEVDVLPTENIDENVFYLVNGKYYRWAKSNDNIRVFNKVLRIPEEMYDTAYNIEFFINMPNGDVMEFNEISFGDSGELSFHKNRVGIESAYCDGWAHENYKTITITKMPTIELPMDEVFINWLKLNSTAIEGVWHNYVPTPLDILGTWVFDDVLSIPDEFYGNEYHFKFSVYNIPNIGDMEFTALRFYDDGLKYIEYLWDDGWDSVYQERIGWFSDYQAHKTIDIHEMPDDEAFINWLRMNATKPTSDIVKLEDDEPLPTNTNAKKNKLYLKDGKYYKYADTNVWVFNDNIGANGAEALMGKTYYFEYSVNIPNVGKMKMTEMDFEFDGSYLHISYHNDAYSYDEAYNEKLGWANEMLKTIEIHEMPDDEAFKNWLFAEAMVEGTWVEYAPITSNDSSDSIVGTWVFNDELTMPDEMDIGFNCDFYVETETDGTQILSEVFIFTIDEQMGYWGISYYRDDYNIDDVYESNYGWAAERYKTIKIAKEPTDADFIAWLKANATKQASSSAGATAYTVKSVDELPNDAPDGSMALVESDSIVGEWEWKDNQSPLDLSMLSSYNPTASESSLYVFGSDDVSFSIFRSAIIPFVDGNPVGLYFDDLLIYEDGMWDDQYSKFEFFTDPADNTFNEVGQINEFKTFIKTNCNRLSGGYSLYICKNGEWVYEREANISGGTGGENYQTCEIFVVDQDCCGPYKVTYKAYENGSLVDKDAVVQNGGTVTINAVQGEEMFIEVYVGGYSFGGIVVESGGEHIDVESRYENGGLYTTVPPVSECDVFICG